MRRAILTLGQHRRRARRAASRPRPTRRAADVADPAASPRRECPPPARPPRRVTSDDEAEGVGLTSTASPKGEGRPWGAGSGGWTATRTVTGAVETTMYGPMQVKVTLEGE